jgi:hypothetical protein
MIDSLLAKIEALTRRVSAKQASAGERAELRRAQVELDLTAPPISGSSDEVLQTGVSAREDVG